VTYYHVDNHDHAPKQSFYLHLIDSSTAKYGGVTNRKCAFFLLAIYTVGLLIFEDKDFQFALSKKIEDLKITDVGV